MTKFTLPEITQLALLPQMKKLYPANAWVNSLRPAEIPTITQTYTFAALDARIVSEELFLDLPVKVWGTAEFAGTRILSVKIDRTEPEYSWAIPWLEQSFSVQEKLLEGIIVLTSKEAEQ